jgi:uncharacterized protein with GYD domain
VFISQFPDDQTCAKFALSIGAAGNVATETLKAFAEPEYRAIVSTIVSSGAGN